MMIVNKKGFYIGFDIAEAESIGLNMVFQFKASKAINLMRAVSEKSASELRRKIKEGAVWFGDEKLTDPDEIIPVGNAVMTIHIGKELQGVVVPRK